MLALKFGFYSFLFILSSSLYSQRVTRHAFDDKMTDIDGKQYDIIKIGEISWVQRNLDVARFSNGDLIKNAASKKDWIEAGKNEQPAWCYYENDLSKGKIYGKLYNWFAVNDSRGLCPKGWHVPSYLVWKNLTSYLGDKNISGGKLKSKGTTYWWNPNTGATNEFGFSALPGGFRDNWGNSSMLTSVGGFWGSTAATEVSEEKKATIFNLYCCSTEYSLSTVYADWGYSVRCVKD
jgi:uncharacterized protein (TIGR02145 family)